MCVRVRAARRGDACEMISCLPACLPDPVSAYQVPLNAICFFYFFPPFHRVQRANEWRPPRRCPRAAHRAGPVRHDAALTSAALSPSTRPFSSKVKKAGERDFNYIIIIIIIMPFLLPQPVKCLGGNGTKFENKFFLKTT